MPDSFDFSQSPRRTNVNETPLLTGLICGLSILITMASLTPKELSSPLWYKIGNFGFLSADKIWDGNYWALFTSVFIHVNLIHLLFNMMWTWKMGELIERTLPPLVYVLFLLGAALAGSAGELLLSGQTGVGMSGVGYAMMGLMWASRGRFPDWNHIATKENLQQFLVWGVICIISTYTGMMKVANAAHAAGFLFGLSVGYVFYAPRRRPKWSLGLVGLALMTVLSLTWVPWSDEWTAWKASRAFRREDYRTAIYWYERSLAVGQDKDFAYENISRAWKNIAIDAYKRHDNAAAAEALAQSKAAIGKKPSGPEPERPEPDSSTTEP